MKKKVRTPWIEFFRTGKFYNYIEALDEDDHLFNELKKKKKSKKYHWELRVNMIDGHTSILSTIEPDTEDFSGENTFDNMLEWFQCSDNPSYVFRFKDGLKIYIRDKITEIQLIKRRLKHERWS